MSKLLNRFKQVIPGVAVVIGTPIFFIGLFGFVYDIYNYFILLQLDIVSLIIALAITILGGTIVYFGTKNIDPKKTFLENILLVGIMLVLLGLSSIIKDFVDKNIISFRIIFESLIFLIGIILFWISLRKRSYKKDI